ncbi:MAG: GNAT family N-acetyltransferase [Planctomycetes bacterium]|nr:GNAT family N-acetyltransferase [Planctomycetota bacterium]
MILISENKLFQVGIANTDEEIDEVLALRFEIFNRELGEGIVENQKSQRDHDRFDKYCDHVIVKEKATNSIIGTYRILRGTEAKEGFYFQTEFDVGELNNIKNDIAEIGRTCIKSDYRGSRVLSFLWFGLYSYTHNYGIKYLFGMTSIHTSSEAVVNQVWSYLNKKNAFEEKFRVIPKNPPNIVDSEPNKKVVPALIKNYLKLGAKVIGIPNFDDIFGCYDIPMIIDLDSKQVALSIKLIKSILRIQLHRKIGINHLKVERTA